MNDFGKRLARLINGGAEPATVAVRTVVSVPTPDDDATRSAARWAREDAGEVPDWDAEERAVARRDREDRDNWNRRAR